MKITKRLVSMVLALIMAFSVCSVAFASESAEAASGFTAEDFLTAKGQNIINQRGEKVRLKGVNLGAWMIWEGWLCPYEDDLDHYTVLEVLEDRFGEEKADELLIMALIYMLT